MTPGAPDTCHVVGRPRGGHALRAVRLFDEPLGIAVETLRLELRPSIRVVEPWTRVGGGTQPGDIVTALDGAIHIIAAEVGGGVVLPKIPDWLLASGWLMAPRLPLPVRLVSEPTPVAPGTLFARTGEREMVLVPRPKEGTAMVLLSLAADGEVELLPTVIATPGRALSICRRLARDAEQFAAYGAPERSVVFAAEIAVTPGSDRIVVNDLLALDGVSVAHLPFGERLALMGEIAEEPWAKRAVSHPRLRILREPFQADWAYTHGSAISSGAEVVVLRDVRSPYGAPDSWLA